jgi:hypothetical protein
MKYLTQLFVTGLIVCNTLPVFAEQIVTTPIASNKKWTANMVSGHTAWGTEACVASTTLTDAVLEVYAEKVNGVYTEPTVQMLFKEPSQVYSAEVSTERGQKWTFTLANTPVDPQMQAVMARLKDREEIILALKQANSFTVKLRDVKNKSFKQAEFSLSGSSKTIDALVKGCELKFETIP